MVHSRLAALLPRLQCRDAFRLERRHYEMMNASLRRAARHPKNFLPYENSAYLCAVLDAYSRIGDARALEDVERIAAGKAASGLRAPEVLEAAQRCLPHLRQAAAELRAKESLLRGAQPVNSPEALLRPAAPAERSEADGLLRSTEADNARPT